MPDNNERQALPESWDPAEWDRYLTAWWGDAFANEANDQCRVYWDFLCNQVVIFWRGHKYAVSYSRFDVTFSSHPLRTAPRPPFLPIGPYMERSADFIIEVDPIRGHRISDPFTGEEIGRRRIQENGGDVTVSWNPGNYTVGVADVQFNYDEIDVPFDFSGQDLTNCQLLYDPVTGELREYLYRQSTDGTSTEPLSSEPPAEFGYVPPRAPPRMPPVQPPAPKSSNRSSKIPPLRRFKKERKIRKIIIVD